MIVPSVLETVGRTPMVELARLSRGLPGRIAAKLEARNPGGSVKDRVAVAMIADAERRGLLSPGATIVEATSGNTGIALAVASAAKGFKLVLTMPERMSRERVALLRYLGAEVSLTPGSLMREAVDRARAIALERNGIQLEQFRNPANPEIHRRTTAEEIWADTGGEIDAFVAGVGTGGTITGVGEVLRARRPGVIIVAVEPERAAVLSGKRPSNHIIQGIGAGFVPEVLNREIIDEIATVTDDEAIAQARRLAREEGISAGLSSGAALTAALRIAGRPEMAGKRVVVMVCDAGDRYMTTAVADGLAGGGG